MERFQENEEAEFEYEWLTRQDYEFKLLALLAVLADSHLAYRGTLADMCDFLGVGSGNSRTNKKIRAAIDALEEDGLLKKITDGRTFTLTLSKKAEKQRRVIRIQKEWVIVAKNYANLPGKTESVGWMPLLKVWLYLIDFGKKKNAVTTNKSIGEALGLSEGTVKNARAALTNDIEAIISKRKVEYNPEYYQPYRDVMALQEDMLIDALSAVKERYGKAIEEQFGVPLTVPAKPFPVVKLSDLYAALEKEYGYRTTETGDLTTQAEQMSYQWVQKHFGHEFLFVTDYSAENRAFYHMRDASGVPQGYDLIWKGVEITTGAQREHRYEVLKQQAQEKGLGEDIRFYLEFFRYGCPPHGGFGMGIDRLMMLLTDLHINETMFLFRSPKRLTP